MRETQEAQLEGSAEQDAGEDMTVFWYDSGDKTALAGGGSGGPQLVIDAAGATNVFAEVKGNCVDISWERVVAADPDVIALADESCSTAKDKISYLEKDPVLSQLRAVKAKRYVTVAYSESTPGARMVDGATSLAKQLSALPAS